jgi:hypothetical protein
MLPMCFFLDHLEIVNYVSSSTKTLHKSSETVEVLLWLCNFLVQTEYYCTHLFYICQTHAHCILHQNEYNSFFNKKSILT